MSSAAAGEESAPLAGSPSDFLKNIVGKRVRVRIGSGIDYQGELEFSYYTRSRVCYSEARVSCRKDLRRLQRRYFR